MDKIAISFILDGQEISIESSPRASALFLLRDHLQRLDLKAGCAPHGICGTCMFTINAKNRLLHLACQ